MTVEKKLAKRARAHIRYTLPDGTIVPGATTILGIIGKPALIPWANKLGLQGIDVDIYQKATAQVGTCCHAMIEAHLKGEELDESDYDKTTLDMATNGFLKYLDWEKAHILENIHAEMPLVSEFYRYGGTIDLYCTLDGAPTLVDFKTSASGIYDEMEWQVAGAYRNLLIENGYPVAQCIILRLGKSDKADLETKILGNIEGAKEVFLAALELYNAMRDYAKSKKGEK